MSFGDVLGVILLEIVVGLVILAFLWPNGRAAVRLLRRWGVAEPTPAEQAEALTYLRRRRFWYPFLFLGLPTVLNVTGVLPPNQNGLWAFPAVLLVGALLAEILAQRRSAAPVRTAVPVHRGPADIVPVWALAVHVVAAVGAVVLLGGALAGLGWARWWYPTWPTSVLWAALVAVVLTVLVVWTVIGLALRRPPVAELRIDPLLRARSARVPVGLSIAALSVLIGGGQTDLRGSFVVLAGLILWWVVASPRWRSVPA